MIDQPVVLGEGVSFSAAEDVQISLNLKNFRIEKGGSLTGKDVVVDGKGFRYGFKRTNKGGTTWLCTHRGLKGKKSCCATVKEKNGVFHEGPSPHCH